VTATGVTICAPAALRDNRGMPRGWSAGGEQLAAMSRAARGAGAARVAARERLGAKRCPRFGEVQPLDEFGQPTLAHPRSDHRRGWCNGCMRAYNRCLSALSSPVADEV
jgi:hypothetical protein